MWKMRYLRHVLLAVSLPLLANGSASAAQWELLHGPSLTRIRAISVHPSDADEILISTPNGVFRTRDGGATYQFMTEYSFDDLVRHPQDPSLVLGNNFISRDGGQTWPTFVGEWAEDYAVAPSDPDIIYAVTNRDAAAKQAAAVIVSSDRGISFDKRTEFWQATNMETGQHRIAVDAGNADLVYVVVAARAVADGVWHGTLYRSTDAGANWQAMAGIEGEPVVVAADPVKSAVILLLTQNGLYRSQDAGTSWARVADIDASPWHNAGTEIYVDPAGTGRMWIVNGGGRLWSSVDDGGTWIEAELGTLAGTLGNASPNWAASTLHAVGTGKALFSGGGTDSSWEEVPVPGLPASLFFVAVDPVDSLHVYAGNPLFASHDGGRIWSQVTSDAIHITEIAFHPDDPAHIYIGKGGSNSLEESLDRGRSWRTLDSFRSLTASPSEIPTFIGFGADSSNRVYVGTGSGSWDSSNPARWGKVYTSEDAGQTWGRIPFSEPVLGVMGVAAKPEDPNTLVVATNSKGIYRTTNRGQSWTHVVSDSVEPWLVPRRMFTDPLNPGLIVVAGSKLYVSQDFGITWSNRTPPAFGGRLGGWEQTAMLTHSETGATRLVLPFNNGEGSLFVSDDLGQTWLKRTTRLMNDITMLSLSGGGALFAATHSLGVARGRLGPPTVAALSPSQVLAAEGAMVIIRGANFGQEKGTVSFSGTEAAVSSWTDGEIVVKAPYLTGAVELQLTTAEGEQVTVDDAFTRLAKSQADVIVNTTADVVDFGGTKQAFDLPGPDGWVSLREALLAVDKTIGFQAVDFNLPTGDAGFDGETFTFKPLSALPPLTDEGLVIDGGSQALFTGDTNAQGPEIVIDGSESHGAVGLEMRGASTVIRNLVIHSFGSTGIQFVGESSRNEVAGCYTGLDPTGTQAKGNGGPGISVTGTRNRVGGQNAADRNVISGNGASTPQPQVQLAGRGHTVEGNYLGTDRRGRAAVSSSSGIRVLGSENVIKNNVVSGMLEDGIEVEVLTGSTEQAAGNQIQANLIGTDASGERPLPNGLAEVGAGIRLGRGAGGTVITGNTIAFNSGDGITVAFDATGNRISRNAIFSNRGLGIDLGDGGNQDQQGDGVTLNPADDVDAGPNFLMKYPVLEAAFGGTNELLVSGTLGTRFPASATIELFANPKPRPGTDPSGYGEGAKYLGTAIPQLDSTFFAILPPLPLGTVLSASATDFRGNTSEFSANIEVQTPLEGPVSIDFSKLPGDQKQRSVGSAVPGLAVELQLHVKGAPEISGWGVDIELDSSQVRYVVGSFVSTTFIPGLVTLADQQATRLVVGGTVLGTEGKNSGDGELGSLAFEIREGFKGSTDLIITRVTFRRTDSLEDKRPVYSVGTITSGYIAGRLTGDFDGDGKVAFSDFFLFADALGGTDPRYDLDGNGKVEFQDFFIFADNFGRAERAKLMLLAQQYLGLPVTPRLEPNYPNPFNAQTAIGYQLSEPAKVHLAVYDVLGQPIRLLVEGAQGAGQYQVVWDGRNERGAPVGSGIYCCRLEAGAFGAVRKMVLLK
jgi:hypothetical protein